MNKNVDIINFLILNYKYWNNWIIIIVIINN